MYSTILMNQNLLPDNAVMVACLDTSSLVLLKYPISSKEGTRLQEDDATTSRSVRNKSRFFELGVKNLFGSRCYGCHLEIVILQCRPCGSVVDREILLHP